MGAGSVRDKPSRMLNVRYENTEPGAAGSVSENPSLSATDPVATAPGSVFVRFPLSGKLVRLDYEKCRDESRGIFSLG